MHKIPARKWGTLRFGTAAKWHVVLESGKGGRIGREQGKQSNIKRRGGRENKKLHCPTQHALIIH